MKISGELIKATFCSRPNRFVIYCEVEGKTVKSYLPNPGRLRELLLPGSVLYLSRQYGKERKTEYIALAVLKNGEPVFLHTHVNNHVARYLIEREMVPGLEGAEIIRPEISEGRSRFDFLLRRGSEEIILEVKSCTLFHDSIAMFPDAVTERGRRHIMELSSLSRRGRKGAVLFLVHAPSVRFFLPDYHTDFLFSRALVGVRNDMLVKAVSVGWTKGLAMSEQVRELTIPWKLLRRESRDSGSYIIILKLKRDRRIQIGNLGNTMFRKGYYLYIGSANRSLGKRVDRHRRKRKNFFWHIDYLREYAEFCEALPVRTQDSLECEIARAMHEISEWFVPGFGASDCGCRGHLFGMNEDPSSSRKFVDTLLHFRIGRLGKKLLGDNDTHFSDVHTVFEEK